jgi:hypothetical protein
LNLTHSLADKLKNITPVSKPTVTNLDSLKAKADKLRDKIFELGGGSEPKPEVEVEVVEIQPVFECLSCSEPLKIDEYYCGECDTAIKSRHAVTTASPEDAKTD